MSGKKQSSGGKTIVLNKKVRRDYFVDERFEAGISLQGWEVKSLRAGKVEIIDSYILLKDGEAYLFGALITPLSSSSTYISEKQRNRKLLLHRVELNKIIGAVERKGFALVPTALYWKNGHVKLEIGVARGKKMHDKRETEKKRDWQRQKARLVRH
ncbi:MAG: SsrA-binding protein [Legionellales bacterium]|jgi:SsrA-binding protein|nr:SsrA-binding protein [Legionellales bacterium]HBH10290.1 SsrA-binding protein [Gammaproteobacteria bacterium]|tara:strand:+ start:217 stop:684 length:468 start_codon:yes stop_codon:yes gene_type:complete